MLLYQCEVQLFLFQVGACHFDGDCVSQAVDTVFTTTAQAVVLFVEFVVIIVQVTV